MTLAKIDAKTGEPVRDVETGLIVRCEPNEPGELVGKIIKYHPIRDFQGCAYNSQYCTNVMWLYILYLFQLFKVTRMKRLRTRKF